MKFTGLASFFVMWYILARYYFIVVVCSWLLISVACHGWFATDYAEISDLVKPFYCENFVIQCESFAVYLF